MKGMKMVSTVKKFSKTIGLIFTICLFVGIIGVLQVNAEYVPPHSVTVNTNSEFDVDLTAWTFQSQDGFTMTPEIVTDTETWGGNGKVLKVTSTTQYVSYWRNRFYQNISVAAGTTYTIRIRAKADSARAAGIILQNTSGSIKYIDTSAGTNGADMALTTAPMEYTYTFTPTVSEVLVLYVNIGQSDVTVYFDYIRCTMDMPELYNLVLDGTFDEQDTVGADKFTDNWVLETKGGANPTISIVSDDIMGSNVFKLTPGSIIGSSVHDVQLNQFKIPFEANKEYYVQFDARADAERTISVLLQQESSPWATYNAQNGVKVYPFKHTYVFKFQPTESSVAGNRIVLKFSLGGNSNAVYIDNVKVLTEIEPFEVNDVKFKLVNEDLSETEIEHITSGKIKYVANIYNRKISNHPITIFMALYKNDEHGVELVDIDSKTYVLESSNTAVPVDVSITVPDIDANHFIKVFLWDNNMNPLMLYDELK